MENKPKKRINRLVGNFYHMLSHTSSSSECYVITFFESPIPAAGCLKRLAPVFFTEPEGLPSQSLPSNLNPMFRLVFKPLY
ncbi:hypothetical protein DPMN_164151 [Dreissena polymorpha]|uniref:Uncharacterized protein n=1 Tax=Dreissena polymorpha TaxID=45954 RepID=A0A9D4ITH0_DREPO|nr:hypothetical protein DPMN_164151 [Dreissena polymorpha]